MNEIIGIWPENDYRSYLMHWGKGKEAKNHKYTSRHRGKNGEWVYTYSSHEKGWNSKEDGVHQRIPKNYKEKARMYIDPFGKMQVYYPETEGSNMIMDLAESRAKNAKTALVKKKRDKDGNTNYTEWNSEWQKNARKAKKAYKKRKRKAKINKILNTLFG